jgi:hypothetical protein
LSLGYSPIAGATFRKQIIVVYCSRKIEEVVAVCKLLKRKLDLKRHTYSALESSLDLRDSSTLPLEVKWEVSVEKNLRFESRIVETMVENSVGFQILITTKIIKVS